MHGRATGQIFVRPWKFFTTITLRKPGKPSYLVPKAYRPIALEDTSSKVIESVIARRLAALAEEHQLLPPNHFGGRPHRTTTDAVLHLTQFIKDSWRRGKVTTVLYLDITSAFPAVNHRRLLHNLRRRRVPEPIVRWIADFLRNRRTQLKFDDFTSDPLQADCGLPQGSPLSPILYLFYSSDLLEIFDPKDRSCLSLGYIDDTAVAVSSGSIESNIRALSHTSPLLLRWSDRHACRFDIGKFQLVHHTRYEPRYNPLPLQIGTHTIVPRDSALYLGIIVDRRLRWREHVEAAVAKGTAAVLAISRLSRPMFGLPHQYARHLYKAVVCPKVEYGLAVWYTPVRRSEGCKRAQGSVGIANRISRIQRLASLMITGSFRSTSTVFLDYHAALLPTELRLNLAAHSAAARLASLPDDHILHKTVRKCSRQYPRHHRSPLHELFHAFPEVSRIAPQPSAASRAQADRPFEVKLEGCKAEAKELVDEAIRSRDTCVWVQQCVVGSRLGIAAVTSARDGRTIIRQACMSPIDERQGHDGALAALSLAVSAVKGCPRVTHVSILVPDRTAVGVLSSQPDAALCRLFTQQVLALKRARRSLRLQIIWSPLCPGEHELVDEALVQAQRAAQPHAVHSPELPASVIDALSDLPVARSVLRKQFEKRLKEQWQEQWLASTQGAKCARVIDDSPPSTDKLKLYRGLTRRLSTLPSAQRAEYLRRSRTSCSPASGTAHLGTHYGRPFKARSRFAAHLAAKTLVRPS
ncbi:hypothetical protein ONZ51_g2095 [Trametes cubensis]|uniref:Reverse transcriptase domain-containing protein n=1 Tax=Trametes cubensis TaxID=1111947 RepID=A0AAD7U2K1_9APHY|nr:hypothetical protein ONZ51_g2095 [Trametes cubensis]